MSNNSSKFIDSMATPFSELQFKHSFRAYQARVLNKLSVHNQDKKVHIVAPPGAGKTILGLEIIKQLGLNTLVLVPTLTIRAQWVERLLKDFDHPATDINAFISHQLNAAQPLTIVTYQALHFAIKQNADIIQELAYFEAIVVDECHHLKREWWRSLNELKQEHQPHLIALTATPPYDASSLEWRRYHDFCGAIDAEITTPELVASKDLCPHQDFIWPVLPAVKEQAALDEFIEQRAEFWSFLEDYQALNHHIQYHPWMMQASEYYEQIYEQPSYFTAMLSVLKFLKSEAPASTLGILHGQATIAPDLNIEWLSIFLEQALFKDEYWETQRGKEVLAPLKRRLSRMNALERKKIQLEIPIKLAKQLRRSANKLQGIADIVTLEFQKLNEQVRLVILCDYIHADALPTSEHDLPALHQIGAAPVFEYLRRQEQELPPMAILTGSLVILPQSCEEQLSLFAQSNNSKLNIQPIDALEGYIKIQANNNKHLVQWVTELFTIGQINIIIGTQALLGEGWDAPAINSLVLANTVGSYVLSNQMRGRAIRTYQKQLDKTANIWHLITIDQAAKDGGHDLQLLKRRFSAFVAPNHTGKAYLSNSFDRMADISAIHTSADLRKIQEQTKYLATAREGLAQRWTEALKGGNQLIVAIEPPKAYSKRKDGLSRYFKLQLAENSPAYIKKHSRFFMYCIYTAIATNAFLFFKAFSFKELMVWSFAAALLVSLVNIRKSITLSYAFYQLKQLKHVAKASVLPILGLCIPFALLFFFNTNLSYTFLFSSIALFGLYVAFSPLPILQAWQFYQHIGHINEFASRIGKGIIRTMASEQLLELDLQHNIETKKDTTGNHFLYLSKANRHQSDLFEAAISEFFSVVDNQRYLLAFRTQSTDEAVHYMPVPSVFKNKKSAQDFCQQISAEFNQDIELIYTRTPAGRLHLVNARLQVLDLNEDKQVHREKIWV